MANPVNASLVASALKAFPGLNISSEGVELISRLVRGTTALIEEVLGIGIISEEVTEYWPAAPMISPGDDDNLIDGFEKVGNQLVNRRVLMKANDIYLTRLPVTSIVSIHEYGSAWMTSEENGNWPTTSLVPTNNYRLDKEKPGESWTGRVSRNCGAWLAIPRCVRVIYNGGLTECQLEGKYAPIMDALIETVAHQYAGWVSRGASAMAGGVLRSISMEGFSASFDPSLSASSGRGFALPKEAMFKLGPFINPSKFM